MEMRARLVPHAARDLADEAIAADMSVTDVFNRSIQLYHYLMEAERNGRQIMLKDPATGELQRIDIELDKEVE